MFLEPILNASRILFFSSVDSVVKAFALISRDGRMGERILFMHSICTHIGRGRKREGGRTKIFYLLKIALTGSTDRQMAPITTQ